MDRMQVHSRIRSCASKCPGLSGVKANTSTKEAAVERAGNSRHSHKRQWTTRVLNEKGGSCIKTQAAAKHIKTNPRKAPAPASRT